MTETATIAYQDLWPDGIKATSITQRRLWLEFDEFVTGRSRRWESRARVILHDEGSEAASQYLQAGEGAAIESVSDEEWQRYIRQLYLSVVPDAGVMMEPYIAAAKAAPVVDILLRSAVDWLRVNGVREAALLSTASRKGIADQIRIGMKKGESQEQIAARIRKHYRSIDQSRAAAIARTEVHAASNYGSMSAAAASREPMAKIWLDTPDGRTRDAHVLAGGQRRPVGQPFIVDGEKMMHPGDSSLGAGPELVVNCRCTMFYDRMKRTLPQPRRRPAA